MKKLLAACAALAFAGAAAAQSDFPSRTVTMLVGFAPGGATDTAARIIAKKLSENLGQTVVVENKAGAGGNIAHQLAANGPADGSVVLFGSVGPLAIAPHLMKLPYDPVRDLAPITMGVNFPNVLVVHSGTGIRTFAEYVAYARKNPGKLDYASTGKGSASHLAGELLDEMAKIDTVHVPYKGGAPALIDLLGGRVAAYFSTYSTAQPHIESGKLVPLASTGPQRLPALPNVPTIAESGVPGYDVPLWHGLIGPKGVPRPIVDRYVAESGKTLALKETAEHLMNDGVAPANGSTPEQFRAQISREIAQWHDVVAKAGVKIE